MHLQNKVCNFTLWFVQDMVDSLVNIWLEEGLYDKTKKTDLIPMRDVHFLYF